MSHRTAVRAALAKDANWQKDYVAGAAPMITEQWNSIMHLVHTVPDDVLHGAVPPRDPNALIPDETPLEPGHKDQQALQARGQTRFFRLVATDPSTKTPYTHGLKLMEFRVTTGHLVGAHVSLFRGDDVTTDAWWKKEWDVNHLIKPMPIQSLLLTPLSFSPIK